MCRRRTSGFKLHAKSELHCVYVLLHQSCKSSASHIAKSEIQCVYVLLQSVMCFSSHLCFRFSEFAA